MAYLYYILRVYNRRANRNRFALHIKILNMFIIESQVTSHAFQVPYMLRS